MVPNVGLKCQLRETRDEDIQEVDINAEQTANEVGDEGPNPDKGDIEREKLYKTSVEWLKTWEP